MFDKSSQKFRNPGPPSPLTEKNPLSSFWRVPLAFIIKSCENAVFIIDNMLQCFISVTTEFWLRYPDKAGAGGQEGTIVLYIYLIIFLYVW